MFEKCGMSDILYGIWKQKWVIAAVVVTFALLGGLFGYLESVGTPVVEDILSGTQSKWVASSSFVVTGPGSELPASGDGDATDKSANTVLTLALADFRREILLETLLKTYTPEEIIQGFDLEVSSEHLTLFSLESVVSQKAVADSSVINLFVACNNKDLARDYMALVNESVRAVTADLEGYTATYMGGILSYSPISTAPGSSGGEVSLASRVILFALIGFLLSVFAVLVKTVFFPTLNRRADFASYNLAVLAEASLHKKEIKYSPAFNAQQLWKTLKEQNLTSLCFVTTRSNEKEVKILAEALALAAAEDGRKAVAVSADGFSPAADTFTLAYGANLLKNASAVLASEACDAVILVENYGRSTHRKVEESTDMLRLQKSNLLGAVALK